MAAVVAPSSPWVPTSHRVPHDAEQVWRNALMPPSWRRLPWFPALRLTLTPRNAYHYRPLNDSVIHSERTQRAVIEAAERRHEEIGSAVSIDSVLAVVRSEATRLVRDMAGGVWRGLLRVSGWVLYHVFSRTYNGITINEAQLALLPRDKPLVFLPTHKTHLDYILVSFLCYIYDIKLPHIAAGENLNIPFFGRLARYHNAFFIRRRSDPSDDIYRTLLREYVIQALLDRSNVEIFIEGGRARNGRPLPPKMGLFSAVVDAVAYDFVEDALLVPVGVSYDSIPESSFPAELLGTPKVTESFWSTILSTIRLLRYNHGHVNVSFGEPISVRDFLRLHYSHATSQRPTLSLRDVIAVGSAPEAPTVPVSELVVASASVVQDLGSLALRHARDVACVSDVSVIALLLTTVYRNGAHRQALFQDFEWLRSLMTQRGFATSQFMDRGLIISFSDALRQLERNLTGDEMNTGFVQMSLKLTDRLHVSFLANQSCHVFVPESVLLTAALSLGESFSEEELKARVLMLCNILESEYLLYNDPHTMRLLNRALRLLESEGLIVVASAPDDPLVMLKVGDVGNSKLAQLLLILIRPVIESYCIVLDLLGTLEDGAVKGPEFVARVQQHALAQYHAGVFPFAESCSLDILQRAVDVLARWDILKVTPDKPEDKKRLSRSMSRGRSFVLSANSVALHETTGQAAHQKLLHEISQFKVNIPISTDLGILLSKSRTPSPAQN